MINSLPALRTIIPYLADIPTTMFADCVVGFFYSGVAYFLHASFLSPTALSGQAVSRAAMSYSMEEPLAGHLPT